MTGPADWRPPDPGVPFAQLVDTYTGEVVFVYRRLLSLSPEQHAEWDRTDRGHTLRYRTAYQRRTGRGLRVERLPFPPPEPTGGVS